MELKKGIKKIIAIATGIFLVGSTLMSSMAYDLKTYPFPFISKDDKDRSVFDGVFVIGNNASPADIIGVTDIATSLQSLMTYEGESYSLPGYTIVHYPKGDGVSISSESDYLEIREKLGQVRQGLTEFDLDGLRGGTITTNEGTTDYNQYLRFLTTLNSSAPDYIGSGYVDYDRDNDDVAGDYLYFMENNLLFEYELEFEEGLRSTIECATGNTCTTGDQRRLRDLEDEQIMMMGKPYTIVRTRVNTDTNQLILELMGGDVIDTLEEGATKTYTIDGKDYEVTVTIVADAGNSGYDSVKFNVNGELTRELIEGQTDVLRDGTEIGVREILATQTGKVTGGNLVEFYLGTNKVKFEIPDYTNQQWVAGVRVNEENLPSSEIKIIAKEIDANTFELASIKYHVYAQSTRGDIYVRPGQGLRQFLDKPEGLLNPDWDIRYEGLARSSDVDVKLAPVGAEAYALIFTNRLGVIYSVPFMDNSRARASVLGLDAPRYGNYLYDFVTSEGLINPSATTGCLNDTGATSIFTEANCMFNIDMDDYFIAAGPVTTLSNTRIVSYTNIDTKNKQLYFSDADLGDVKAIYTETSDAGYLGVLGTADLVLGGFTYKVYIQNVTHRKSEPDISIFSPYPKNFPLAIDMTSNEGIINEASVKIFLKGSAVLEIQPKQDWTSNFATNVRNGTNMAGTSLYFGNMPWRGDSHSTINLTMGLKYFDSNGVLDSGSVETINISVRAYDLENSVYGDVEVPVPVTLWDTTSEEAIANGGMTRTVLDLVSLKDVNKQIGISTYGSIYELDQTIRPGGEASLLTITHSARQRIAEVFVVTGKETVIKEDKAKVKIKKIVPIGIGITKLASEINDVKNENMIVVGGPCINSVALKLMGNSMVNPEDCANGFEFGKAIVKLFENDGKYAMLIAGYGAQDTQLACGWVAEKKGSNLNALTAGIKEITLNTSKNKAFVLNNEKKTI